MFYRKISILGSKWSHTTFINRGFLATRKSMSEQECLPAITAKVSYVIYHFNVYIIHVYYVKCMWTIVINICASSHSHSLTLSRFLLLLTAGNHRLNFHFTLHCFVVSLWFFSLFLEFFILCIRFYSTLFSICLACHRF